MVLFCLLFPYFGLLNEKNKMIIEHSKLAALWALPSITKNALNEYLQYEEKRVKQMSHNVFKEEKQFAPNVEYDASTVQFDGVQFPRTFRSVDPSTVNQFQNSFHAYQAVDIDIDYTEFMARIKEMFRPRPAFKKTVDKKGLREWYTVSNEKEIWEYTLLADAREKFESCVKNDPNGFWIMTITNPQRSQLAELPKLQCGKVYHEESHEEHEWFTVSEGQCIRLWCYGLR